MFLKTKTVHTGVEFDVDGVVVHAFPFGFPYKGVQQLEAVYFGFQFVFENSGETAELWIHHQDGQGDATVPKFYPFVSYGHCDGIAGVGLQRLGNFQGAATIARGFDHGDDLGGRFKIGLEVIQVVHQGIQINFQHRFMDF